MKYGFYCNHCGYSFMSDNKKKVVHAKKNHKMVIKLPVNPNTGVSMTVKSCPLVRCADGILRRPSLAGVSEKSFMEKLKEKFGSMIKTAA